MTLPWRRVAWILVAILLVPAQALAAGGGGGGDGATQAKSADPDYTAAVQAIEVKQFARAIPLLEGVATREPGNADAWNQLAYATRKNGDPAKSREHLARLDRLCFFGCEEYRDLKKAVEAYEKAAKK